MSPEIKDRRPLTGLVLCGGESRRMGAEKALIDVGGRPLVVHVSERLAKVATPVLLASGGRERISDVRARLLHLPVQEVDDEVPGAGPLAGLIGGLAASPHPLVAVVAVDMPFLSPDLLSMLAGLHAGEDAVVPVTDIGLEPLHAVYSTTALPAMRAAGAEGRLALRDVLAGLAVREVREAEWRAADPSGRFAVNLNRAEDLRLLRG
jgi:molybdopterin-guanine dinucleotide biosynthesis protein A